MLNFKTLLSLVAVKKRYIFYKSKYLQMLISKLLHLSRIRLDKMSRLKMPLAMFLGFVVTLMLAINTPNASAEFGQRNLKLGAMGPDVMELQKNLHKKGYNPGPIDGVYSIKTQTAVKKWQKDETDNITGQLSINDSKKIKTINNKKRYYRLHLSEAEKVLLAQAVYGEARGESLEGQVAVAAVIINRTKNPKFPKSVQGVIYEPWAFTAVYDGQLYMQPDSRSYRAVELALRGWDPSGGAIYYFNPQTADSPWIWSRPVIKQIGKHLFAL